MEINQLSQEYFTLKKSSPMRIRNLLAPLFVFAALLTAIPEYVRADGGTPPGDDKRLKRLIKRGDNSYEQKNIREALTFYGEAMKEIPDNAGLMYKTGICYMFLEKTDSAMLYFENAYELDNGIAPDITFFLARTKQLTGNYDEAVQYYNAYLGELNIQTQAEQIAYTRQFISECENATKNVPKNDMMRVLNLGGNVNTSFPEYAPCITADGNMLVYTARRPEFGPKLRKQNSDFPHKEDIYIAKRLTDTTFTEGEKIGTKFNKRFNNAAAGVAPDGKMLFVYNNKKNGNVYFSEYQAADSSWAAVKEFGKGINTKHHESSVAMTADRKTLYFVSDRPEGSLGRNDIWTATLSGDNVWSEPRNLGSTINTAYDEESIYITPDGKIMYFSSKGHNTIGGYDIFKSEKDASGNWTTPQNIGLPINTPGDDVFFSMADSIGYFASVTGGGVRNFDIFAVKLLPPAPDTTFFTFANVYIKEFKALILGDLGNNSDTASFMKRTEIPMFGNIHFDFDKDKIKKESTEMLDLIMNFLAENPNATIGINGHTDNVGSYAYNLTLSKRRAAAAIKYLTDAGLDKNRVNSDGFSFSKPIDTNKTAVGRAVNRRCEFQINNPE